MQNIQMSHFEGEAETFLYFNDYIVVTQMKLYALLDVIFSSRGGWTPINTINQLQHVL